MGWLPADFRRCYFLAIRGLIAQLTVIALCHRSAATRTSTLLTAHHRRVFTEGLGIACRRLPARWRPQPRRAVRLRPAVRMEQLSPQQQKEMEERFQRRQVRRQRRG